MILFEARRNGTTNISSSIPGRKQGKKMRSDLGQPSVLWRKLSANLSMSRA